MKHVLLAAALLLTTSTVHAQVDTNVDITDEKKKYSISVGSDGIKAGKKREGKKDESQFELQYGMLDLGFNRIHDEGEYYRLIPQGEPYGVIYGDIDGLYLPLRENKSVNVNVYPLMMKLRLSKEKRENQNFYLTSGLGMQLYNFRFERGYNYTDVPTVGIQNFDSLRLQKNKLAFNYLTVPLSILGKTRVGKKTKIVYGVGVMGGYRLSSWTKLKTADGDKIKNHDNFAFQDFNACATAELGVDDVIRLYASYQLTPLHMDGVGLDQRPFCIGVRLLGL